MTLLNLAHWAVTDGVNGPGRRFTVWAQGCTRNCPGCFNPGLLAEERCREVSVTELAGAFSAAGPVDGVTLSGGEPFDQAEGLAAFLALLSPRDGDGPSVVVFTGYTIDELKGGSPTWGDLLGRVDLLVDGPFQVELAAADRLTGSSNQRRLALTARGADLLRQVDAAPVGEVQLQVTPSGEVVVSGFPDAKLLAALRKTG